VYEDVDIEKKDTLWNMLTGKTQYYSLPSTQQSKTQQSKVLAVKAKGHSSRRTPARPSTGTPPRGSVVLP